MAKTTKLILNGSLHWAKVFEFNREMTDHLGELLKSKPVELVSDEDAGAYEIEIHISQEEAKKIAKAGARQKPKIDRETGFPKLFDDGYAYRFRRFHSVPKAPPAGGAPEVVFRDGTAFDPDLHGLIGNGTKGSLEIRVDQFQVNVKGRTETAARAVLQKVIIDDLVEYSSKKNDVEVVGDDTPAPAPSPAEQPQVVVNPDLNEDEIPF